MNLALVNSQALANSSNFLKATVDHVKHLIALGCSRGQVLITAMCDKDIVLNAYAADGIVCLKKVTVDELGMCRVVQEVSLNERTAEVA